MVLELRFEGIGWVDVSELPYKGLRQYKRPVGLLLKLPNYLPALLTNLGVRWQTYCYWLDKDFKVIKVSHLEAHYGLGIGRGCWVLELPLELFRAGLFKVGDYLEVKEARTQ